MGTVLTKIVLLQSKSCVYTKVNNLRYVDVRVLIPENLKELRDTVNIIVAESQTKGLSLNSRRQM